MFHCVVTRSGTLVKCFIEGEQKAQKTQTLLHDYGDVPIGIANSSNMGFVRVWNYALSADEIATLYNNGDPMGYVVPKAKRDSLLAEYLPQNLMYGRDDKTIATSWLDSAKQMPLSDEYMEPLFQSIGGYDMAANGAPEILYNSPKLDSKGVYFVSNGEDKNVHVVDLQLPNKNSFAIQLYAYNIEKYEHSSIVQIMLGSINYNIVFAIQDDTVVLYVGSESSIIDTPAQDIFNKDIVFNVNDTYIDVYVNNEKCDTLALKSPISLDVDNFFYALGEYIQVSMVRIFSEALTPDDIETLHNNGKPDAYVLPLSMKEGDSRCILEWLPKNIIPDQNNTSVASEWLDTATVPPPAIMRNLK